MLFHRKIELYADTSPEETAEAVRAALQNAASGLHGKEADGEFLFDCRGRGMNAFRPEIRMKILPDAEGCLLWADMQLPKLMYAFMAFWTVVPVLAAIFGKAHALLLPVIPVFWVIAVIAFRNGVKAAQDALMEQFSACEVVD